MQRIESVIDKNTAFNPLSTSEPKDSWQRVKDILSKEIDDQIYKAWILPLEIKELSLLNDTLNVTLLAINKFALDHVSKNYSKLISSTFSSLYSVSSCEITFKISESHSFKRKSLASQKRQVPLVAKTENTANINQSLNFSNFVIGSCNQFAHAASLQVAENLGRQYNPLFIYGGVGLGKTHLANAIGNASRRRNKKVLLVSSEVFVSELISGVRSNSMHKFKAKYRSLDLLIIDDIQFLDGKERTQEEFFHTFNELHQGNKQIILTSDKVPQELTGIEERLRTRFASGLTCDLQAPDFETRVAILCKKAEAKQIELDQEVANLIAESISTNVRELEGALNRLIAISDLRKAPIDQSLAREIVKSLSPKNTKEITAEEIQKTVVQNFNISLSDIIGKRRTQNIAFARQVAMYLCRKLTTYSYPEIGTFFGGRDHSTVIHAYKSIDEKTNKDSKIKEIVEKIKREICG